MADQTPSPTPRPAALVADCPNTPRCEHPAMIHDVSGDPEDPKPMCCAAGCTCGQPPSLLSMQQLSKPTREQVEELRDAIANVGTELAAKPSVHIAAEHATFGGRYVRQRCAWCGFLLAETDTNREAAYLVEAGRMVQFDRGQLTLVEYRDGGALPAGCCALPPLRTSRSPRGCAPHAGVVLRRRRRAPSRRRVRRLRLPARS